MVALILLLVMVVLMLKAAELAPAATVTLAGTTAFLGLLLASETTTDSKSKNLGGWRNRYANYQVTLAFANCLGVT
jgi:hypothetical protein